MNMFTGSATHIVGKILSAVLITIVVVGTSIAVTRFVGPLPLSITQTVTQKQSTFNVTGKSEMNVVPDQAEISAGIEASANTVAAAQDQANKVINAISDAVKKLGVDKNDIQTQNYSVSPDYDYQTPGRPHITGYRVSTNLRIKTNDFDKLNQIIDTATQLGANQVNGVQFSLSKKKQDETTAKAREEAITNAKHDADQLAKLAGIRLGKVIDIQENTGGQPPIYMMADQMAVTKAAGGAPTQVQPGSTNFMYTVTLSYETL